MIQKMKAEIETGTLNAIIGTVSEISAVFGDQKTEYLSAQTVSQNREKTLMREDSGPSPHTRHKGIRSAEDSQAAVDQANGAARPFSSKEFRKEDA